MVRRILVPTFFVAVIFHPLSASSQQLLRWKMTPGQQLQVSIQQDIHAEAALMGTEMKSSAEMQLQMNWHVRRVTQDGTAEIEQSIDRFRMKMASPGQSPIEVDTASAEPPTGVGKMLLENVQPMIGLKILQQMNGRGEILDVRLSEEAQRQLSKGGGAGELQQMFSADGLKSLMSQSAAVLPNDPVQPGDTWKGSATTDSPAGELRIDLTYLYRGTVQHEGVPVEHIDVNLHMQVDDQPAANGLHVSIADQSGSGSMLFDARIGRFVQTQLKQQLTLNTKMGQHTQSQKVTTDMRIDFRPQGPTTAARSPAQPTVRPVSNAR